MKTMRPMSSKQSGNHEFYTPEYAVTPILKYIPEDVKKIWLPCDNENSKIYDVLKQSYNCILTHIDDGVDFITHNHNFEYDMIITNPPYDLKTEFLEKAYKLGKPFLFLMPITTLEGVARHKLFRQYGLTSILFDKRVNFIKGKSCQFNTSWFGLIYGQENKVFYEEIGKNNRVIEDLGINKKQGKLLL